MTKLQLHDYQIVGREFLRGRPESCLFMDMGLGKTATVLSALEERHLPVLVVAPKRVASSVWPTEQRMWRPDLTLELAAGRPADRLRALQSDKDIIVLGRDNLRDVLQAKRSRPFKTIVIDELSGFKSRGVRWKAMRRVRKLHQPENVWGLTGTPMPNGYLDLWPQMAIIDGGKRLGTKIGEYREEHFTPGLRLNNGIIASWNIRPGSAAKIKGLIEDVCLFMETDGRVELPPVTMNEIYVELPTAAKRVYREMKTGLISDLELLGGEVHTAKNAATLTNKLSQITAGFMFVDQLLGEPITPDRVGKYDLIHREKLNAAKEVVEGTGSPVLMFYRYIPERDLLLEMFRKAGIQAEVVDDDPETIERWNRGEIPVLLAHPASAGHGLNLQHGGHTIVWTSLPWSLEEWQQANKRVARQGQKHPVVIHLILVKRSIDPHMLVELGIKDGRQGDLLEHLRSPI